MDTLVTLCQLGVIAILVSVLKGACNQLDKQAKEFVKLRRELGALVHRINQLENS